MSTISYTTAGVFTTRFLGPTTYKGARIRVTSPSGRTKIVAWDHALNPHSNHASAVAAFVAEIQEVSAEDVTLYGGWTKSGYAFAATI